MLGDLLRGRLVEQFYVVVEETVQLPGAVRFDRHREVKLGCPVSEPQCLDREVS